MPKLVPCSGDLLPYPDLIQSVQSSSHGSCLTASPLYSTTGQLSCTEVERSRIVLAILHQTVSYLDGNVVTVVFTNVMRKLLI